MISRALAATVIVVAACLQLISHSLVNPAGMLAFAAVVLAALALALLAAGGQITSAASAGPLTSRASALREKARSAVFQRQLNPDAAGHPRPRAPAAVPAAA